jgi:transposase
MKATARFGWLVLQEAERSLFLEAVRPGVSPEHFERIRAMTEAFPQLLALFEEQGTSLDRVRKIAFGAPTEKTAHLGAPDQPAAHSSDTPKRRRKGHGRRGAAAYTGARRVPVAHPTLKTNQKCPECQQGKLHLQPKAATAIHLQAQPPIAASVYEMEVLRCALCGKTFTAPLPTEAGQEKCDPSVGVMVGMLRYGAGMPFYRLEQWQENLGVPLPASTQWELANQAARQLEPIFDELAFLAAQAPTVCNDDTTMRVSQLRQEIQSETKPERTGIFTTGVVAQPPDHPIALFFTGRQHAGENLNQLLQRRSGELPPPLQMCDGLSRNAPKEAETILACCLAHGRRGFFEVAARFPEECQHVLQALRLIYQCDAQAKEKGLSAQERLVLHQAQSGPVMDQLKSWLDTQINQKRVEPNSGLGEAIQFMQRHWVQLTRFLHEPGAPLDNNACERILKTAILHRKNSLSYKTQRGSKVGDLFMSLIQTCRLNRINPFAYLLAVVRHSAEVKADPKQWLPWNYPASLPTATPSQTNTS